MNHRAREIITNHAPQAALRLVLVLVLVPVPVLALVVVMMLRSRKNSLVAPPALARVAQVSESQMRMLVRV